ncbi:uncharacterized protein LOC143546023 [Bidens hawaiensis]|uniref:uncharacterized protein LOC143546023 n=1 Tax=Bidens hawaiensis TaxID=980011 RepID=UPI00404ADB1E
MAAGNRSLIELPRIHLEGILTELPLPSLLACCAVSKSLLKLIKEDSEFARTHLAKSEPQLMLQSSCIRLIDLDTDAASRVEVKPNLNNPLDGFRITHSCNGLVLLEGERDNVHRCMIYNPVTGEYTLLPEIVARDRTVESGFFYCPKTNQFEVLRTFIPVKPVSDVSSCSSMDLYLISESGSDTDMELDVVSDHDTISEGSDLDTMSEDQAPNSNSLYSENGAVGENYAKDCGSWQSLGILPFSPTTLYSPCHFEKAVHWDCCTIAKKDLAFIVVGNRLSIFDAFSEESTISVWVMKKYGVKDSWSREYVIDDAAWTLHNEDDLSPLTCRNNGELVMVSDQEGYILFYDLNKKEGRVISHPPLELKCRTMMHTPSFISLRDVVRVCSLEVVDGVSGSKLKVVKGAPRLADPGLIPNNYLELATTDLGSLIDDPFIFS